MRLCYAMIMRKSVALILFISFILVHHSAYSQDVETQSAGSKAQVEEDAPEDSKTEMAELIITEEDILGWEESGKGKYLYFILTEEKNEELAKITEENLGKPLKVYIGNHIVIMPEVTSVMDQKNGFVLMAGEGQRFELTYLLDPAKKRKTAKTDITIGSTADDQQ